MLLCMQCSQYKINVYSFIYFLCWLNYKCLENSRLLSTLAYKWLENSILFVSCSLQTCWVWSLYHSCWGYFKWATHQGLLSQNEVSIFITSWKIRDETRFFLVHCPDKVSNIKLWCLGMIDGVTKECYLI